MGGEVLEWMEPVARDAHVQSTIERGHRLAQREVAPRPGVRLCEVRSQYPVTLTRDAVISPENREL